jgi:hypothetical protein
MDNVAQHVSSFDDTFLRASQAVMIVVKEQRAKCKQCPATAALPESHQQKGGNLSLNFSNSTVNGHQP